MTDNVDVLIELKVLIERVTNLSTINHQAMTTAREDIFRLKQEADKRWEIIIRLDEQQGRIMESISSTIAIPRMQSDIKAILDREKKRDDKERDNRKILWTVITGLIVAVISSWIVKK